MSMRDRLSSASGRALILIAIIAFTAAVAWYASTRIQHFPQVRDMAAQRMYWESRIRAVGGKSAYAELHRDVARLDTNQQHVLAHVFGGALYRIEGSAGISVCDDSLSNGCYHELIGEAIAAHGVSVASQIERACDDDIATPCRHGIGHGLVGYFGYAEAGLDRAIEVCNTIAKNGSLQGCDGGAFMEYNMRTLAGSTSRQATADLYEPCDRYAGASAQSCYLYQPQWWWVSEFEHRTPTASAFKTMGLRCASLRAEQREVCYQGLGLIAASRDQSVSGFDDLLCKTAAVSSRDFLHCADAMALVLEDIGDGFKASQICEMISEMDRNECRAYLSGARSI